MDAAWLQTYATIGTVVLAVLGALGLGRRTVGDLRRENREAHARIGTQIAKLREDVDRDIAKLREDMLDQNTKLRDDVQGEIAKLRDDMLGQNTKLRDDVQGEIANLRDDLYSEISAIRQDNAQFRQDLAEFKGEMRSEIKGLHGALLTLREDFRTHVYGSHAN